MMYYYHLYRNYVLYRVPYHSTGRARICFSCKEYISCMLEKQTNAFYNTLSYIPKWIN
jgi:hypothetical protein